MRIPDRLPLLLTPRALEIVQSLTVIDIARRGALLAQMLLIGYLPPFFLGVHWPTTTRVWKVSPRPNYTQSLLNLQGLPFFCVLCPSGWA